TKCYQHAGFTLDESDSQVVVGVYVTKVEGATDCPADPARAFKWGTVKLAEPLGGRELVHAGLDEPYVGFVWDSTPAADPGQGQDQEGPADEGSPGAEEGGDGE
ncbi:MAG: hypothetical protein LBG60_10400, partial [Bifidobacteriaceae bacterium]|nr:hypothetical protein [Bifidobacteriaceae bacterium]